MYTFPEIITSAKKEKKAIGHFNVSNIEMLRAVCEGAEQVHAPIIIGVSEGERSFFNTKAIAGLVAVYRELYSIPLFLNADHTHSLEGTYEAIEAGYDSVLFDGSSRPLEENIEITKKVRLYLDEYNKKHNTSTLLEGEVGYIGSGSEVFETLPEGVSLDSSSLTTPQQAERFIRETGVDLFAPAVGNVHGMYKNKKNPHLDIERIRKVREQISADLVLHGGSGIEDENIVEAVEAGISIIHVSTELRVAWKRGFENGLQKETTPYKIAKEVQKEIRDCVVKKLLLYGWN